LSGNGDAWTCWPGSACALELIYQIGFNVQFINELAAIIHPHGLIGEDGTSHVFMHTFT
jgi:hypothetical protein